MRTRVAPTLGPLAETLFATRLLHRDEPDLFHGWRQQAQRHITPHTGLLGFLYGGNGYLLDLFTITGRVSCLEEGLAALMATPPWMLRGELEIVAAQRPLPSSVQVLADDCDTRMELAAAIRQVHNAAVGPGWGRLRAYLDAADATHGRVLATGGVEQLLASVHPLARWRPPVLEIRSPHRSRDVYLQGRGLVLIPSVSCWPWPMVLYSLADAATPNLLIVPAVHNLSDLAAAWAPGDRHQQALVALLGRTRAAVLEAVADGCTTTELARRVGVSAPSASQHAQVLRDAGLLLTRRVGKSVHHSLTVLGATLLDTISPDPRPRR